MKRTEAGLTALSLAVLLAAAVALPADRAASQTPGEHRHAEGAGTGAAGGSSKGAEPTPTADGKLVQLPGVPPGKPARGGGVTTTITAEVMDPACFLEAGDKSIGAGHYQCAIDCTKSGQTLALYDRSIDRIYFIAGELPGRNPNDPLTPYIHKKVDVLGTVYNRSQAWGIVIIRVTPHKEKGAAAPSAPASPRGAGSN